MPTYRNDSSGYLSVTDLNGVVQDVAPGATVQTHKFLSITGLTKTDDTPLYNPVAAITDVTFSGAEDDQTIALQTTTHTIRLHKVSGGLNVDLYLQAKSNTPAVIKGHDIDDYPTDVVIDGKATQIVLDPDAAGSCQIVELKE